MPSVSCILRNLNEVCAHLSAVKDFLMPHYCVSVFFPLFPSWKSQVSSVFSGIKTTHMSLFFYSILVPLQVVLRWGWMWDSTTTYIQDVMLESRDWQDLAQQSWRGDDCCVRTSGSIIIRAGKELLKLMDNVGMGRSEYKHTRNRFRLEVRFQIIVQSLNQRAHKKNSG